MPADQSQPKPHTSNKRWPNNRSAAKHVNKHVEKDIFIEIEPSSKTSLVVEKEPEAQQQVEQLNNVPIQVTPVSEHESKQPQSVFSQQSEDSEVQISDINTVTRLTTANGTEVYVIGTAHFSTKSVEDVQKVIRTIRPAAVILELCRERAFMLSLDEQSLLEQNKKLSFQSIRNAIAEKGVAHGLIYIMFIKMSANLTEKLGLAPGSELRAGAKEAKEIPGCAIVLGDRSLRTTVARAVASVSTWQKIKLIYQVLVTDVSITQEDVEKCKEKDMLEQLLQELGGEYPGFKKVILDERNVYLAHSIYQWAQNSVTSNGPRKVVAIVGVGHVAGIAEHWGTTTDEEIVLLNEVPEVSRTRIFIGKTIKYCSLALFCYVGYRIITPSHIQKAIGERLTKAIS